jgi:hypothetical protein
VLTINPSRQKPFPEVAWYLSAKDFLRVQEIVAKRRTPFGGCIDDGAEAEEIYREFGKEPYVSYRLVINDWSH